MTDPVYYPSHFYRRRDDRSTHAAEQVFPQLADVLPRVHSVTDYGCGVGTWLSAAQTLRDATGIVSFEGPWLDPEFLVIDAGDFECRDRSTLENPPAMRISDLALCLEVAEHLPAAVGDHLVRVLTSTSDFILFSAAIPNQGGKGLVHEQWQYYWISRFAARAFFSLALFRHALWNDADIGPWYRQNLLRVAKRSRLGELALGETDCQTPVLPVAHPKIFRAAPARQQEQIDTLITAASAWRAFRRALLGKPYRVRPRRARDPRDDRKWAS